MTDTSSTSPYNTDLAQKHFNVWLHQVRPNKSIMEQKAAELAQAVRQFFDKQEKFTTEPLVPSIAFVVRETVTLLDPRRERLGLEVRFENGKWTLQWYGPHGSYGEETTVDISYNANTQVFEWSEDTDREDGLVMIVKAVLAELKRSHQLAKQSPLMGG